MKIFIFIIFSLFINYTSLISQNLNDSLILHYPINGNCNDISGNNFHATIIDADLSTNRYGIAGSAYSFNGTDNYIELPNYPKLKPQLPVSIAFWAKLDVISTQYNTMVCTDFSIDAYAGIFINMTSNGNVNINYGDGTSNITGPGQRRSKTGTTAITANEWNFFIFVVRGANDMDIYINCKNDEGTYSGSGGPLAYNSNPGVIGKGDAANFPTSFLKGDIDDFYFWNRALDTNDLKELCMFTHVDFLNNQEFSLFPNPAIDKLNVKSVFTEYTIYNSLGQKIMSGILNRNENNVIEIKNLNKGVYFMINTDGKNVFATKFIKA